MPVRNNLDYETYNRRREWVALAILLFLFLLAGSLEFRWENAGEANEPTPVEKCWEDQPCWCDKFPEDCK